MNLPEGYLDIWDLELTNKVRSFYTNLNVSKDMFPDHPKDDGEFTAYISYMFLAYADANTEGPVFIQPHHVRVVWSDDVENNMWCAKALWLPPGNVCLVEGLTYEFPGFHNTSPPSEIIAKNVTEPYLRIPGNDVGVFKEYDIVFNLNGWNAKENAWIYEMEKK